MKLSPHFTLRELTTTSHRTIDNTAPAEIVQRLQVFAVEFLEPVRLVFGPLWITSGYRCPELNNLIRGSVGSAHLYGCAADFVSARGVLTTEIVRWIADESRLPFDQVIDEHSSTSDWVHLGMVRPTMKRPRGEALTMRGGRYTGFNPLGV